MDEAGPEKLPVEIGSDVPETWGEYERMLDEKGRITIPPKIRCSLGTDYIIARGSESSLLAVPAALWPTIEVNLEESLRGDLSAANSRYQHLAILNRTHVSLDRQGRLKLPKHLLEWASLSSGDPVAIVGLGVKFEIWNKRRWNRHVAARLQPDPDDSNHLVQPPAARTIFESVPGGRA